MADKKNYLETKHRPITPGAFLKIMKSSFKSFKTVNAIIRFIFPLG